MIFAFSGTFGRYVYRPIDEYNSSTSCFPRIPITWPIKAPWKTKRPFFFCFANNLKRKSRVTDCVADCDVGMATADSLTVRNRLL